MGSVKEDIKDTWLGAWEFVQEKWTDLVHFLFETWVFLLLLLVGLLTAWWLLDPPPPKQVFMATGSRGGLYEQLGNKYVDFFAKNGVQLTLVPTHGSQENIDRLADQNDPVHAAFVQGGMIKPAGIKGIQSLGSIAFEPIWFFYRGTQVKSSDFDEINGRMKYFTQLKISAGVVGSATHEIVKQLFKLEGMEMGPNFVFLSPVEAVKALQKGNIDGVILVDGLESENIQTLLNDPSLNLASFKRPDAIARLLSFLEILTVPMGAFDLVRNIPPADVKMLATTTHLLIDERMHPAIQFLFLEAAREINGKASFFAARGTFPGFRNSTINESPVALHYERKGSPWLMEYLPFWLAELVNRLLFVLIPLCAFAYPILLTMPNYRTRRIKTRINRMYAELKDFEQQLMASFNPSLRDDYLKKLDLMEYQALLIKVPKSIAGDYYALRTSIDYVRNCLNRGFHPYNAEGGSLVPDVK